MKINKSVNALLICLMYPLNTEKQEIFMNLKEDLNWLSDEIYDLDLANKGFILLMENNKPPTMFFNWLKEMYDSDMILRSTRILEKNDKGITLNEILKKIRLDCNFKHLHAKIDNDLKEIEKILKVLKVYRDKIFAHSDRDAQKALSKIEKLKHSDIDDVIAFICNTFFFYKKTIIGGNDIFITENGEDYTKNFEEIFKNVTINYKIP